MKSFSLARYAPWLRAALLMAAFLSPFTMYLRRHWPFPAAEPFYAAGYAWMGIILIAASVFACSDLAGLLLRRAPCLTQAVLAWTALAALGLALASAFYGGLSTPGLKEITVPVKDLPAELEGFRIAQISDMHIDSAAKMRRFRRIVEIMNSAGPDLVLVTGDFIDPGLSCREELAGVTAGIKSHRGVYGSLGNHEYYYGLHNAMACYEEFGIKLLRNASVDLGPLRLTGIGDIHSEGLTKDEVGGLVGGRRGAIEIVMSHQPLYYDAIAARGPALTLSGHTHRGQIFPFNIFTRLFYPYFYGAYRIKGSFFYVTSGAGTWGPSMRFLAPSEVPLFILRRA